MIKGIKHIIFDLGGVILNIDYSLTQKAFAALGIQDIQTIYSQLHQSDLFDQLETGNISQEEFINKIKCFCSEKTSDEQIYAAWNALILDFPLRRLQILQQLRLYYDLILLSNTNEIHEAAFNKVLFENHGLPGLATLFDRIYYSHRIGLRKPHAAIFERVLADTAFRPEHTLFIDDSLPNVEAASKLGIQTIHLAKGMTMEDDIFKPIHKKEQ